MTRWVLQQRYCKTCGTPVEKNKHYCPKCKHERELAIDRERYRQGKKTPGGPHRQVECKCVWCGKTFKASVSDVKRGRSRFCSLSCAGKCRHVGSPRRKKPPSCALKWAACPVCGKQFIKRTSRTYCSDGCAYQARLDRLRDTRAQKENARERPLCVCAECGEVFRPEYGNRQRRYCSGECANRHAHRAKHDRERSKGTRWGEKVGPSVVTIGKRDGWRCYLCGKKVNPRLKAPHPGAASRDHLVPKNDGGSWDASNLRLAHIGCNSRRGTSGDVQLLLFG